MPMDDEHPKTPQNDRKRPKSLKAENSLRLIFMNDDKCLETKLKSLFSSEKMHISLEGLS